MFIRRRHSVRLSTNLAHEHEVLYEPPVKGASKLRKALKAMRAKPIGRPLWTYQSKYVGPLWAK